MTAYSWKPKSGLSINAQAAGHAIEELRGRLGGQVSAADVLSLAQSPNSPLHSAFEWDDTVAAAKYRLEQAGHVLRSLVVRVTIKPEAPPISIRAFVNVVNRETDQRGYVSLDTAMSDQDYRAQVVQRAWQELQQWRDRYQEYAELGAMVSAISAVQPVSGVAA